MKKSIKYFTSLALKMTRDFKGNIASWHYLHFWDAITRYDSVIEEPCHHAVNSSIGNTTSSTCNLYQASIHICQRHLQWQQTLKSNSSAKLIVCFNYDKKDFIKSFFFCLFSCSSRFCVNEIWIRDQCIYTGTYLSSGYSWLWRPTLHGDWCSLCLGHWLSSLSDRSQLLQIHV